jgi:hypothetical protein
VVLLFQMRSAVQVAIVGRQSKVDQVHPVCILEAPDTDIIWLDVTMKEPRRMEHSKQLNTLHSKQKHIFQSDLPLALHEHHEVVA